MPELPEVETTRRGILPYILDQKVQRVVVRQPQLRWPIPRSLAKQLPGEIISVISRRGKYLLLHTHVGILIIHLGMSGHLRVLPVGSKPNKHDHVDIIFHNQLMLRLSDPRRFGAVLWTNKDYMHHPLLVNLGPEPLTDDFNGDYLYRQAKSRKIAVKQFIMDGHIVVGVGNIYANEALFMARIHPEKPAGEISLIAYKKLVVAIKEKLQAAIECGGTTIRNFLGSDGKSGYFAQQLYVYGREGHACKKCQTILQEIRLSQRSSVFCPRCQRR